MTNERIYIRTRAKLYAAAHLVGVSGGAMVLDKLLVSWRPTYLDNSSRARSYCACSGCGWGLLVIGGWSGGAKVLGKLPVPGRPTNLAYSRARAYCAFSRCGWGLCGHFFSHLSLLFSFSLPLGDGPI